MKTGIAPVISIVVLVLITISVAGGAWIYMSTYFTSMTGSYIEVKDIDCSNNIVEAFVANRGTQEINIEECIGSGDKYDCGDISVEVSQKGSGIPVPHTSLSLAPGKMTGMMFSCEGAQLQVQKPYESGKCICEMFQ